MVQRPPRSTRTDTLVPHQTCWRAPRRPAEGGAKPVPRAARLRRGAAVLRPRRERRGERRGAAGGDRAYQHVRSEEHTSELQSLMRISYAVFCLNKKHQTTTIQHTRPDSTNESIYTTIQKKIH